VRGDERPPFAEITRIGRWTYNVVIRDGLTQYGPDGMGWHVLGSRRAERKARRELDRYLDQENRRRDVTIVR